MAAGNRDVAIVSFEQTKHERKVDRRNEIEMMMPIIRGVYEKIGLPKEDIGFVCSGSTDFLAGQAFSFVTTLDAFGPWPPISESHVEMDGAWALYEAWVKLQMGEIDTALVYSYGKSSPGPLREVLALQQDPYYLAPLGIDSVSLAALQARAVLDAGKATPESLAEIATRNRRAGAANPYAHQTYGPDESADLSEDHIVSPLHRFDCPPITDGGAAVILAAGDKARELTDKPAWIRGIDHRIDTHQLGARDLTVSDSTRIAAETTGVQDGAIDIAELHAPFTHQEVILRDALGLGDGVSVNPSGGPLSANPLMAAGLIRLGEAATRLAAGDGSRAVATATSGACLQQNLVCVLEVEA
jgi:acetyl-CoA acetyltransferase